MHQTRDPILLIAAILALGVAVAGGLSSSAWLGKTFPGFLLLENHVVASAGLAHWPAVAGGEIYQHEVVRVDGAPLTTPEQLRTHVESLPVGSEVVYRLRSGEREIERRIETRAFGWVDFALLFGSYLVCGLGLTGVAITVRFLGRRDPAARGSAASLWIIGMWALTATDLYGPYQLFRVHAFLECLLFASTLHLALVFPTPRRIAYRFPALVPLLYASGCVLGVATEVGLQQPASYVITHRIAVAAFGASMVALIASQLLAFIRPASFQARQRVKVLAMGTVAALTPQVVLSLGAAAGGEVSENLMGWSGIFFPLSIGYAVLRSDLLQVDAILRRTVNYALLTIGVALGYAGTVSAFETVFRGHSFGTGWGSAFVFALVSVAVLLPLRDRLQSLVDRLFFRSAYDFRRLVEGASRRLASVTDLRVISDEVKSTVTEALQPETLAFEIRPPHERELPLRWLFADNAERLVHADGRAIEVPEGGLVTTFEAEGRLVALLVLGRRLGGQFYTGDDRSLLNTLANQGAVAIENALALEQLHDLNRSLEQRVDERTRDLADALAELRETQRKMVHQEKMASIGQLVAGVAHEINNPINFIQGNVCFVEEHTDALVKAFEQLERAARARGPDLAAEVSRIREECDLDHVIEDLPRAFESCQEGLDRTTAIIRDLRSFSRNDSSERQKVDLCEAIDSSLSLLQSRLTGIEVVRDYEDLPDVECLGAQIGQVFINLLTNAADATGDGGRIVARTRRAPAGFVTVEVEDDGCGIAPDQLERIFDPFFSTKEVGKGTGLGLSITYGIVSRHGGRIEVRSEPGRGTCFHVELPMQMRDTGEDTTAPHAEEET